MSRLVRMLDISERLNGQYGCIEQSSSNVNNNLLCLFIKLVRGIDRENLHFLVKKCESNNVDDLVNLMIIWWETRSHGFIGKGERSIFYDMIPSMIEVVGIEAVLATISLIPHYGYYKDFCYILEKNFDERLNERIIDIFTTQLIKDYASFHKGGKISIASKYAPSEKTHFGRIARIFAEKIFANDKTCYKQYRKLKSDLNRYSKMCDTKIYDGIQSVDSFPDMISKLSNSNVEKEWYVLLNFILNNVEDKHIFKNALALVDMSDDMVGKSRNVAVGLGLIISELSETYHNRLLTFGSDCTWINLSSLSTVSDKLNMINTTKNSGHANLSCALEKLLVIAEDLKLDSDEFPKVIFIFSGMQFTEAKYNIIQKDAMFTHYESLHIRFKETGERICGKPYQIPKFVFWNLKANIGGFQTVSTDNVQCFSGFDASLLKYVNIDRNSSETLLSILKDEKYLPVRQTLSELNEGIFKNYEYLSEKDGFVIVDDDFNQ